MNFFNGQQLYYKIYTLMTLLVTILLTACSSTEKTKTVTTTKLIEKAPVSVVEQNYRNLALFDYKSRDYFKALTEIAIGEHKTGSTVNPKIEFWQASVYLDFNMESQQLKRLLKNDHFLADKEIKEQVDYWLNLARFFYQKSEILAAKKALKQIDKLSLQE